MNFYEYLENRAKDDGIEKIVVGAVITMTMTKFF